MKNTNCFHYCQFFAINMSKDEYFANLTFCSNLNDNGVTKHKWYYL